MVGSHLADYLLENTDWIIHGMCRWRSPQNNIEHLIPENITAKHKIEKELKDKRRKGHFFHGKIQFDKAN